MAQPYDLTQDLDSQTLHVQGVSMAAKPFRQCVFILDELLSCFDCYQFLIPVPATAVVYHKEIKTPMDFKTLEQNLYNDKYKQYEEFIRDLCLIWDNAKSFHRNFDPLYQQAENLYKRYQSIASFMEGGPQPFYLSTSMGDITKILNTILPEERLAVEAPRFPMYKEIKLARKTNLYFIQALSEQDCLTKKLRGFTNVRVLFQHLNAAFFNYMNSDASKQTKLPLPRFYIAKNRTLLNQARTDKEGALAILYNVHITPMETSSSRTDKDLYRLRATVALTEAMGETHNFDESTMDKSHKYEFCPKAWLKLKVLNVVHNVEAVINSDIDRNYFKRVYNTFKLSTKYRVDPKKVRNQEIAKQFVRSILEPVSSSTVDAAALPIQSYQKQPTTPTSLEVNTNAPTHENGAQYTSTSSQLFIPKTSHQTTLTSSTSYSKPKSMVRSSPSPTPKQMLPVASSAQQPIVKLKHPTIRLVLTKTKQSPSSHNQEQQAVTTQADSPQTKSTEEPVDRTKSMITNGPVDSKELVDTEEQVDALQSVDPTKPIINRQIVSGTHRVNPVQSANIEQPLNNTSQEVITTPSLNTLRQMKRSCADLDYDTSSTASYEYSEDDNEDERKHSTVKHEVTSSGTNQQFDVNTTKTDTSNITTVNPNNSALHYNNNHLSYSPFSSMQQSSASVNSNPISSFERYLSATETMNEGAQKQYYLNASKELWQNLSKYSNEKGVPVVDVNQYNVNTSSAPNAEGFFKHVFFMSNAPDKVVQTFRRMTITQRTTEIVSLLALKGLPHMGQITEVLKEKHGEIIGLCMQRYEKTLKQYTHAHSHHRLTAYQKMDLVIQMLQCIETIHKIGLAHRDLSEVNFMVNTTEEKLRDGSPKAQLFLIDFGKSTFTDGENYRRWWVEQPRLTEQEEYDGEIVPKTAEELKTWCQQLPWVRSKPDHGYRLYRSIQTLPKSRTDTDDLPWMINPLAEDLYSIGTIIWKTFSETEPWYGILDTDLKGLRETVGEDYYIERALQREVAGKLSRELLLKFLRTSPEHRQSATEVLAWLEDINIQNGLIAEWEQHAPVRRQKRHAKALFRYDDEQAAEMEQTPYRKRVKVNIKQNGLPLG